MYGARVLVFALLAFSVSAQVRVSPIESKRMDLALAEALAKQKLLCDAEATHTFLDFAFRFEIGYVVHCPLKEFGGEETPIAVYLRVQPPGMTPEWFSEVYRIPGVPDDLRSRINLLRDHNEIQFSGVVAAGEGEYGIDLVVVDRRHRLFHKNWKVKVYPRGAELKAPVSMRANSVAALDFHDWSRTSAERCLQRLTVLVDAAPIRVDSTRLRAWDRAFLVESLSSVLTLLPSATVRVVAFNLDQEREVFAVDDFNPEQSQTFSDALEQLELGKISYHVLEDSQGASDMLLRLLSRETAPERHPDAVVLLGPANRLKDKLPPELVSHDRVPAPPVFYLKYSPVVPTHFRMPFTPAGMRDTSSDIGFLQSANDGEFPDVVQHAAALYGGATINVHCPADLADALKKIDYRLHNAAVSEDAGK